MKPTIYQMLVASKTMCHLKQLKLAWIQAIKLREFDKADEILEIIKLSIK